jgi:hypothetical protein
VLSKGVMRAGTVLLLLATIAWAQDCPFCEVPMVGVRVKEAVHSFCRSCSATVRTAADGTATASVRVKGERRTFILPSKETISRRHWEIVRMGDLEPDATEGREGGRIAPGHPISRPGHPVTRPGHAVSRPGHPVSRPGRILTPGRPETPAAGRPALLVAARKFSPPARRSPPRRYHAG